MRNRARGTSARHLAAIDSISTRAHYIAMKEKRNSVTTADVRKAMQESVILSDNKLHTALGLVRQKKQGVTMRDNEPSSLSEAHTKKNEFQAPGHRQNVPASSPVETPLFGA
jgi:hypothetical protein